MSNHSSEGVVPQQERDLSSASEKADSLTQTNLQQLDTIKSKAYDTGRCSEVDRHWKGVQAFNRQIVFELDPELRDPSIHSDSSAEYASHFDRVDNAQERLDAATLYSLNLYKDMPKGGSPLSTWASGSSSDWPDKSYLPHIPVDILPSATLDSGKQPNKQATSTDCTNDLTAHRKPHELGDAIEYDECDDSEYARSMARVRAHRTKRSLGESQLERVPKKLKMRMRQADK